MNQPGTPVLNSSASWEMPAGDDWRACTEEGIPASSETTEGAGMRAVEREERLESMAELGGEGMLVDGRST